METLVNSRIQALRQGATQGLLTLDSVGKLLQEAVTFLRNPAQSAAQAQKFQQAVAELQRTAKAGVQVAQQGAQQVGTAIQQGGQAAAATARQIGSAIQKGAAAAGAGATQGIAGTIRTRIDTRTGVDGTAFGNAAGTRTRIGLGAGIASAFGAA